MNSTGKIFITLLFVLSRHYLHSQDTINSPSIEQLIENIAEQSNSDENDLSNLFDELTFYKQHPVNLNQTTAEELLSLHLLNEIQVNNILDHINRNGPLLSIYELQSIEGFGLPLIYTVLPYITIESKSSANQSIREIITDGNHRLILRALGIIEPQRGYNEDNNTYYQGSPYKIYTRYRFTSTNKLSVGITGEKDAGEEFLKGAQKQGFDFYSAHLYYEPDRTIKKFVLGDYVLNFGQGLNLWQGFAFSKTSDVISIKKISTGINPYLSTDENRFMRGGAVTAQYKKIEFTGFFSQHPIDGNITDYDSISNTEYASSLQESGLHNTPNEIANRHSIQQTIYGGNINYKTRNLKTGFTSSYTQLDKTIQPYTKPYSRYYFSGNRLNNTSLDYSYTLKNFIFFGEGALSYTSVNNPGYGYINGLIAALDPGVSFSLLHRNYSRNYSSFFSNAFAEASKNNNEQGIYTGIQIKISQTLSLNCYYDRYKFPWLKYRIDAPSIGEDWFIQMDYTPSKKTTFYTRYKIEKNYINAPGENYLTRIKKQNFRVHGSYSPSKNISLRSRIEFIHYKNENGETERGNILIQDIIIKRKIIALFLRYALFDTPSYESRIYTYENDLPGSWSSPAYYYKGSRMYSMIKIKAGKNINCWLRYSQSFYSNKNVISPGTLNEITGNTKSEIKAQVDITF